MPKLRDLRSVDASFASTGPNTTTLHQKVNVPAASLFRALEDGPAWKDWLGIDVAWTSPKPFGLGTTRTIGVHGQTMDEVFTAWETGRRMSFRFDRATVPLAAFAEDYIIESHGDSACELHWTYAFEWGGPLAPIAARVFGAMFKHNGVRSLKKLADLVESTDRFDGPSDSATARS